jgi:hypothetical protein
MSADPEPQALVDNRNVHPPQAKSGFRVSRAVVNFWVDVGLLMLFVVLAAISTIVQFAFPASADATGWSLWGWSIIDWRNAQFTLLCLLAGGIVLHLMLHWTWIVGILNQRIFRRPIIPSNGIETLLGVGLLLLILHGLAGVLLVARYYVVHP